MKFDIVQAWKDEDYRQSLSEGEHMELPVNPVGELSDAELQGIMGGDGGGYQAPAAYHAAGSAAAASTNNTVFGSRQHCHSWGLTCDINVFSAKVDVLEILSSLIDIGNSSTQICVHRS